MRIVLAGGTGQIGAILQRAFADDEVVVIARSGGVRWDGRTLGAVGVALEGADALINLAGRTVDCRYTPANRRAIMDSRLESTRVLRRGDRRCARAAAGLAAVEHGDDLRRQLRPGVRRVRATLGGDEPDVPDTWRFSIDVARRVGGGGGGRGACGPSCCARRWS